MYKIRELASEFKIFGKIRERMQNSNIITNEENMFTICIYSLTYDFIVNK